ncbi:type IV pilus biogenesis/stability protein PilW [Pseudorhodoferax sp.]|uniref:type IV pilus biogenesis/stability protein PilW n=1 Tax=Pseudorhodoferax sp. TaxID=1993553 RepID=UPI001B4AEB62|nr:type IV pilus biogenesis/stability protein PilW [Pseudorhodoferax sp.]MBP8144242.1 type IV pilus biogenesis/stability protein PilW [Inhella sp.]
MPRALLLVLATILLLGACATQTVRDNEPRTDSDASGAERRAATRVELAAGYFARGQYNVALDELKQALTQQPNSREALNLRALVLAAMGENAAAEEGFQRLLTLYPNDADTLHNRAWFYCQQGKVESALRDFDAAVAQPGYRAVARSWLARGACEMRSLRWADAKQSLARAFELDPGNPAIAYNLAEALLHEGEGERARFYAARVNAVAEQMSAQSLWLATRIEKRLGNAAGVSEWGQRLLRQFPQSAEAQAFSAGRFE